MSDVVSKRNITVIIPAFNEEKSLPNVVKDLPKVLINDIIVVDNNSTDQTASIAKQLGCRVVSESIKGYGQACLSGIAALSAKTEIVVFIDGDYSDHPEQLPILIQPILDDKFDFVIGSRIAGRREHKAMTPQAYYGNKLACFLMKLFWNVDYTDLGPFRAITYPALQRLNMQDRDFGWTIEMQIKAVQCGLRITEVPVDYRCRIGKSKISGTIKGTILAGEKILRTIFKYKFFNKNLK
ncbi:MAG: glycosyltransferase family 2 protein [Candidatus Omnitrophica bacterium]|nr:glycosyltransferase family 2 protein [Candidatus Omnitrophota bacterium]